MDVGEDRWEGYCRWWFGREFEGKELGRGTGCTGCMGSCGVVKDDIVHDVKMEVKMGKGRRG